MTGILDQFEDLADATSKYGNSRDRRGRKQRGKKIGFFQSRNGFRAKIKRAQAVSLRSRSKT